MKLYIIPILNVILFNCNIIIADEFEHSHILPLPEMDFFQGVFTGLDILEEMEFKPLYDKKIAVLTNQTAVNRKGIHLLDLLNRKKENIFISVIFTPEFGLFAHEKNRIQYSNVESDPAFGIRVKNLWGNNVRPDKDDLQNLDLILIDLQDPGIRYFSYITTITKVMEAASLYNIPVMILDRPNPLGGAIIDGPTVRPQYQSFIGYHLVPVRHGLTVGEYCLMINETGWIRQGLTVDLTIIPLVNWDRNMLISETGLPWINPAPDIENFRVLSLVVGMGLIEGTNLSYGLGTDFPYQVVGAPWLKGDILLIALQQYHIPGVRFSSIEFTPDSSSVFSSNPVYSGELCEGIKIELTDEDGFSALDMVMAILSVTTRIYPHRFHWVRNYYIDKLYGHDYLRVFIAQERDPIKMSATWTHDIIKFSQFREKYLLY